MEYQYPSNGTSNRVLDSLVNQQCPGIDFAMASIQETEHSTLAACLVVWLGLLDQFQNSPQQSRRLSRLCFLYTFWPLSRLYYRLVFGTYYPYCFDYSNRPRCHSFRHATQRTISTNSLHRRHLISFVYNPFRNRVGFSSTYYICDCGIFNPKEGYL